MTTHMRLKKKMRSQERTRRRAKKVRRQEKFFADRPKEYQATRLGPMALTLVFFKGGVQHIKTRTQDPEKEGKQI